MSSFDWRTFLARLPRRVGFRLVLFAVVALGLVGLAAEAGPFLPDAFAVEFGQESALRILEILASSMLAVTTFSLTAMISAYGAAARGTTPRATQLLIADRTSQNALATFLGTFVFSIVGVIALTTGTFSEQGRSVLFLGTLGVIAVVVVTLLRWIHHLTGFGRVPDVIDRVEQASTEAVSAVAREPHLGGAAPIAVPDGAIAVCSDQVGCVTGVTMRTLQEIANATGGDVHVDVLPGSFVGHGHELARVTAALTDAQEESVRQAFRVERHRTFEQDPRLGMVALAEIGSRALSPATNDPGTAIEALGALQRVLTMWLTTEPQATPSYPRVHVPEVGLPDMLDDAMRPLARDGAHTVEVALRIQGVLCDLVDLASTPAQLDALAAASVRALERATAGLTDAGDRALVQSEAERVHAHIAQR